MNKRWIHQFDSIEWIEVRLQTILDGIWWPIIERKIGKYDSKVQGPGLVRNFCNCSIDLFSLFWESGNKCSFDRASARSFPKLNG